MFSNLSNSFRKMWDCVGCMGHMGFPRLNHKFLISSRDFGLVPFRYLNSHLAVLPLRILPVIAFP